MVPLQSENVVNMSNILSTSIGKEALCSFIPSYLAVANSACAAEGSLTLSASAKGTEISMRAAVLQKMPSYSRKESSARAISGTETEVI